MLLKVCLSSHFLWFGFSWGPWFSFGTIDHFSVIVAKITSRIEVSWAYSVPSLDFHFIFDSVKWPYYQKYVNKINLNQTTVLALLIFKVIVLILLDVNLSFNETTLIFLLYVTITWKTQLVLVISMWCLIYLKFETILLLKRIILQLLSRWDLLLQENYL